MVNVIVVMWWFIFFIVVYLNVNLGRGVDNLVFLGVIFGYGLWGYGKVNNV